MIERDKPAHQPLDICHIYLKNEEKHFGIARSVMPKCFLTVTR